MPEPKTSVEPEVFFRNVGSGFVDSDPDEPTGEAEIPVAEEKAEGKTESPNEKDVLLPDESDDEKQEELQPAKEEKEEKTGDITDDYEIDVVLDGEKSKATIAQLRDSYERHKVSTQRFEAASKMRKEAEAYKASVDKQVEGFKVNLNRLGTDPEFMLDFYQRNAPKTLHAAFERYAEQLDADNKLYEHDPAAYNALAQSRRQGYEARRAQEQLAAEKAKFDEERKLADESAKNEAKETARLTLSENLPKAMIKHGLLPKGAPKRVHDLLEKDLRQYMYDHFDEKVGVTREYIYSCTEKFAADPEVKELLATYGAKTPEKPKKDKDEMSTVEPVGDGPKSRIRSPADFFRGKITSTRNPPTPR